MTKIKILLVLTVLLTALTAAEPSEDLMDPGLTPDHPLYFMDRFSDSLELTVAQAPVVGSDQLEAKVRANHAEKRLSEAMEMTDRNNTEEAERLFEEYNQQLNLSVNKAGKVGDSEINQRIQEVGERQEKALNDVRERVPENAKASIDRAIERSQQDRQRIPDRAGETGRPDNSASETGRPGSIENGEGNIPEASPERPENNDSDVTEVPETGQPTEDRTSENPENGEDDSSENLTDRPDNNGEGVQNQIPR